VQKSRHVIPGSRTRRTKGTQSTMLGKVAVTKSWKGIHKLEYWSAGSN